MRMLCWPFRSPLRTSNRLPRIAPSPSGWWQHQAIAAFYAPDPGCYETAGLEILHELIESPGIEMSESTYYVKRTTLLVSASSQSLGESVARRDHSYRSAMRFRHPRQSQTTPRLAGQIARLEELFFPSSSRHGPSMGRAGWSFPKPAEGTPIRISLSRRTGEFSDLRPP
jgi:hypothetical protein